MSKNEAMLLPSEENIIIEEEEFSAPATVAPPSATYARGQRNTVPLPVEDEIQQFSVSSDEEDAAAELWYVHNSKVYR